MAHILHRFAILTVLLRMLNAVVAQTVVTLAGSGAGHADGQGTNAKANKLYGGLFDSAGNFFCSERNANAYRKLDISTNYASTLTMNTILVNPGDSDIDFNGDMFIADTGNHRIVKYSGGVFTVYAGTGSAGATDGVGTRAQFNQPTGLKFDIYGNMIVSDMGSHLIRKVFPNGTVTTIAGSTAGFLNAVGTSAQFSSPAGLNVDWSGNVFVLELGNRMVRKIAPDGTVSSASAQNTFTSPCHVGVGMMSDLFVFDGNQVFYVNSAGTKSLWSGTLSSTEVDGPISSAIWSQPCGYVYNAVGDVMVVGQQANKWRRMFCPSSCSAGSFNSPGSRCSCLPCSRPFGMRPYPGQYQQCGLTCPTGATCTPYLYVCNAGFELNSGENGCSECQAGFFKSTRANGKCSACPSGATCTTTAFVCKAGWTINTNANGCAECVVGLFKPNAGNLACGSCPTGATCTTTTFTCNAGWALNTNGDGCTACPANSYKPNSGNVACSPCPSGAICTSTAFTCNAGFQFNALANRCDPCGPNSYKSIVANTACTPCPTGSVCTPTAFTCNAGWSIDATATGCFECSAGTFKTSPGNVVCSVCPTGATCSSTSFTCNAGWGINTNSNGCIECAAGFFKPSGGNVACSSCPTGAICSPASFTCNVGFALNSLRNGCEACGPNTFKPTVSNSGCVACPQGATCSPSAFTCNAGWTINGTATGCSQCALGFFKPTSGNFACTTCPPDATCSATTVSCNAGFGLAASGTSCVQCVGSTYRPENSQTCVACPNGAACTPTSFTCGVGYGVNATLNGCVQCGGATYKPVASNDICSTCPSAATCTSSSFVCHLGFGVNATGNGCTPCSGSPNCNECPANAVCDRDTFLCKPGYEIWQSTNCNPCPTGKYKSIAGNIACNTCPLNSVCDATTFQCSAGYQSSGNNCQQCPVNTFKPTSGNAPCMPCPANSVCDTRSFSCAPGYQSVDSVSCTPCPPGSFKPNFGNNACSACPTNSQCNTTAYLCEAGFQSFEGRCSQCSTGTFKTQSGNTQCTQCPLNSVCDFLSFKCDAGYEFDGLSTCTQCQIGKFKSLPGNTLCTLCPENSVCYSVSFLCNSGYRLSGLKCELCANGTFKTSSGNGGCQACPPNAICSPTSVTCLNGGVFLSAANSCAIKNNSDNMTETNSILPLIGVAVAVISLLGIGFLIVYWRRRKTSSKRFRPVNPIAVVADNMSMQSASDLYSVSVDLAEKSSIAESQSDVRKMEETVTAYSMHTVFAIPGFLEFTAGLDYVLEKLIKEGGASTIHIATAISPELDKQSANHKIIVKKMKLPRTAKFMAAFMQEIAIMHRFSKYPYFCRLLGFDEKEFVILMKLYHVGSLRSWIKNEKFPWCKRHVVQFASDLSHGVQILHKNEVAHCDLKSDNLLIDIDPKLKTLHLIITDFGLSRVLSDKDSMAVKAFQTIAINGASILYAAPEIIVHLKQRKQDQRSKDEVFAGDIYAVGCIFYDLLNRAIGWTSSKSIAGSQHGVGNSFSGQIHVLAQSDLAKKLDSDSLNDRRTSNSSSVKAPSRSVLIKTPSKGMLEMAKPKNHVSGASVSESVVDARKSFQNHANSTDQPTGGEMSRQQSQHLEQVSSSNNMINLSPVRNNGLDSAISGLVSNAGSARVSTYHRQPATIRSFKSISRVQTPDFVHHSPPSRHHLKGDSISASRDGLLNHLTNQGTNSATGSTASLAVHTVPPTIKPKPLMNTGTPKPGNLTAVQPSSSTTNPNQPSLPPSPG